MRLPRVQYTMCRMMAGVAIVAIFLTAICEHQTRRWRSASLDYELRALLHSVGEEVSLGKSAGLGCTGLLPPNPGAVPDLRKAVYHAEMRRKWSEAANRPCLSVEPDPPPP